MRTLTILALAALTARAQSPAPTPRFDVADVHPSAHSSNPYMRGPFIGGVRYEIRSASMLDLIQAAYDFAPDKILGGPNWLESDRFDIDAKAARGTDAETMKAMLRSLLTERFSLAFHKDTRPQPAYVLLAGPKPQLKQSDGSEETGCAPAAVSGAPAPGGGRIMTMNDDGVVTTVNLSADGTIRYSCRNVTMAAFAEGLKRMMGIGLSLGTNPVQDRTGLKGAWNFDVKWSMARRPMADSGDRITVFAAVEKQLGLKLEQRQIPQPVIVVDSVNREPTPNLPGVTRSLPALPTEFEVADIKPADPNPQMIMYRIQPGGRVNIQGMTLKDMIQDAWDLPPARIVGGPKSIETDRWDIVAKAPTFGPGPATGISRFESMDRDAVNAMVRALLIDRFKLKVHTEERPVNAFTLTAIKPKLKKADPSNRTGFQEGPGADGKDPRVTNPMASRLVSCRNMTMAQLAENLPRIAAGYIQSSDVLDATGLEGAYDFTLNFSVAGMAMAGARRGGRGGGDGAPGAAEASDPGGAITLAEALKSQLGLKLEQTRRPASVLVIDSVEAKPTEN
jgi:uncharacterized protein (TIGR03435 family)